MKLKLLILGLALMVFPTAAVAQFNCWYPSICYRIECYFSTPEIASSLSMQQISDFTWYYFTFCWV